MLRAVDALNAGCPVVFLDGREHKAISPSSTATRQRLIQEAKEAVLQLNRELRQAGTCDELNACALARFHDVLFGDGDPKTTGALGNNGGVIVPQTIHAALRYQQLRAAQGSEALARAGGGSGLLKPASPGQIADVAEFLADHVGWNSLAWEECNNEREGAMRSEEERMRHRKRAEDARQAASQIYGMLLSHESFHGANVVDLAGIRRLVQTIVKLDRLPKENTVEALELLQQAWVQHDIAVYAGNRYIRLANILYAFILVIGVATVICTTSFADASVARRFGTMLGTESEQHVVFALSMMNTALLMAVKFYNPTVRGNQLRASAATLQSIIWFFRARVGTFSVPQSSGRPSQPTAALREAMTSWHAGVVGGTDLLQTPLERKHSEQHSMFKHCQFQGDLPGIKLFNEEKAREAEIETFSPTEAVRLAGASADIEMAVPAAGKVRGDTKRLQMFRVSGGVGTIADDTELEKKKERLQAERSAVPTFVDDHQSPVRPAQYVQLRLLVVREKYQSKIPRCCWWRRVWEVVLTACTIASATLSYAGSTAQWVAVSTAIATAVTSWVSYDDLARRIERYSNAVRAVDDLIWWWKSLDDAERANTLYISKLIETGEAILAAERLAWIAAAKKGDEGARAADGGRGRDAEATSQRREGARSAPATRWPQVGNDIFAYEYTEVVSNHWRVRNDRDIVTRGLRLLAYKHVGKEVRIDDTAAGERKERKSRVCAAGSEQRSRWCSFKRYGDDILKPAALADHSLVKGYQQILQEYLAAHAFATANHVANEKSAPDFKTYESVANNQSCKDLESVWHNYLDGGERTCTILTVTPGRKRKTELNPVRLVVVDPTTMEKRLQALKLPQVQDVATPAPVQEDGSYRGASVAFEKVAPSTIKNLFSLMTYIARTLSADNVQLGVSTAPVDRGHLFTAMYHLHLAPASLRSKWLLVAKLYRLFDYFDANGDGFLQLDEAVHCFTKIAKDEGLQEFHSRGEEAAVNAFLKAELVVAANAEETEKDREIELLRDAAANANAASRSDKARQPELQTRFQKIYDKHRLSFGELVELQTRFQKIYDKHRLSFGELVHYVWFETEDRDGNVGWKNFKVEDVRATAI
eukprot:g4274.t1